MSVLTALYWSETNKEDHTLFFVLLDVVACTIVLRARLSANIALSTSPLHFGQWLLFLYVMLICVWHCSTWSFSRQRFRLLALDIGWAHTGPYVNVRTSYIKMDDQFPVQGIATMLFMQDLQWCLVMDDGTISFGLTRLFWRLEFNEPAALSSSGLGLFSSDDFRLWRVAAIVCDWELLWYQPPCYSSIVFDRTYLGYLFKCTAETLQCSLHDRGTSRVWRCTLWTVSEYIAQMIVQRIRTW